MAHVFDGRRRVRRGVPAGRHVAGAGTVKPPGIMFYAAVFVGCVVVIWLLVDTITKLNGIQ